jgi:hypothetical protein
VEKQHGAAKQCTLANIAREFAMNLYYVLYLVAVFTLSNENPAG